MNEKNVIAGRYELLERIGDGGMAVVYKARCRLLKRFVAIKILKPEFTRDIKFVDNFRRESHAAASLSHPNIVGIYDVGQEGNINYIVMELVEGKTLSELIDESAPLDYKLAISIGKQVARGLSVAHKNNIVHRDVKPHNILITEDGVAKITDFGIAKAVSDTTIVDSGRESIMGSVHYFSPEQAKGENATAKSDIYSFGIILFEMLTGRVPFDGDNPVTIALMQINEPMTPPSIYNQNIPPRLENIILKSTEKDAKNRYSSFEEIERALDDTEAVGRVVGNGVLMSNESESADYISKHDDEVYSSTGAVSRSKRGGRDGKKGKKPIIIAGIAAAMAALLIGVYGLFVGFGGDIETPDLKGLTIEEAAKKVEPLGLKVEAESYKNSSKYKKDLIISQNPDAKTKVSKGKVIKVVISKGNTDGIIPDVVGKSEDDAKKMIEQYGFSVGKIKERASDEPKGTVIEQTPSGGSSAKGVTDIDIVVSDGSGNEKCTVPNLLGMSKEAARKALENEGLKLGSVSEGSNSSYGADEIIWQSYNAGTKIEKGESVDIKINAVKTGSASIYLPLSDAKSQNFTLDITVSDDLGSNRHVVSGKSYSKTGEEMVTIEGAGRGSIVVKFDGVEVLRKEVKFS